MSGQRLSPWLLPLFLALSMSTPLALQPRCSTEKKLAVTMYSTNATGHRAIIANLEQPLENAAWPLDVEVSTSECGRDDGPRQLLTFTLNGTPEEALLSPSPPPSAPRALPSGYITLPGYGHYRELPDAKSWHDAFSLCRKEGGGVVTPTSRAEVELLFAQFQLNASGAAYNNAFWTSANDIKEEGKFVTDDGVPLEETGFAVFYPGSPTISTATNCVVMRNDRSLVDTPCTSKYSVICKVPL